MVLLVGAGDEGGDYVGGVPVEGYPGPVIAQRGPVIGVRRGLLDVSQRHSRVETGREQCSNRVESLSRARVSVRYLVMAGDCRSGSAVRSRSPGPRHHAKLEHPIDDGQRVPPVHHRSGRHATLPRRYGARW
jgi:hypothetical protein